MARPVEWVLDEIGEAAKRLNADREHVADHLDGLAVLRDELAEARARNEQAAREKNAYVIAKAAEKAAQLSNPTGSDAVPMVLLRARTIAGVPYERGDRVPVHVSKVGAWERSALAIRADDATAPTKESVS